MALSPLGSAEDRAVEVSLTASPSKTYSFDFTTEQFGGVIGGLEAIKQFVRKVMVTARFRFMIYGADYGSEVDGLIGKDVPDALLQSEIPRVIRDSLIYDERIRDVYDFGIRRESDRLYVSFTVDSIFGETTDEVVI